MRRNRLTTRQDYMKIHAYIVLVFILTSCASGSFNYEKPKKEEPLQETTKNVDISYSTAWNKLIEAISATIYSIDHINKDSGFISLNFSASSPQQYVDCGIYQIKFENFRGKQNAIFNGAESNKFYNTLEKGRLVPMRRDTFLSAKINLYLKKLSPNKTQLKVNARYILAINGQQGYMNDNYTWSYTPYSYEVIFSTGEFGMPGGDRTMPACISNGFLEKSFLDML